MKHSVETPSNADPVQMFLDADQLFLSGEYEAASEKYLILAENSPVAPMSCCSGAISDIVLPYLPE